MRLEAEEPVLADGNDALRTGIGAVMENQCGVIAATAAARFSE